MGADMAALVWRGGHDVAVQAVARPEPREGWAIVDVAYAGLCGTDLHICAGEHPRASAPLVIGHELVGTLRTAAGGLPAGSPVAVEPLLHCGHCTPCRTGRPHVCETLRLIGIDVPGGVAEAVSVPEERLVALPEDASLRSAAFVEPLAVCVHAVRRSGLPLGDTVMVAGAGPIGLGVALCAQLAGAGEIFVSEPAPARREAAAALGCTVLDLDDPTADLLARTAGERARIVFDSAAHPAVAAKLPAWTATGGRIVLVGTYSAPPALDLQTVVFRELDAVGCRVYTRADFETAVALIASGRIDPDPLITRTVPLADAPEALERLRSGEELKVLVEGAA